jgi:hypothetical protein
VIVLDERENVPLMLEIARRLFLYGHGSITPKLAALKKCGYGLVTDLKTCSE